MYSVFQYKLNAKYYSVIQYKMNSKKYSVLQYKRGDDNSRIKLKNLKKKFNQTVTSGKDWKSRKL